MNYRQVLLALFLLFPTLTKAETPPVKKISTPQWTVKTNVLYWASTTPNLGIEIGTASKQTLDVSAGYNPFTLGTEKKLKHWMIQPEYRWWLCEKFNGHFFGVHAHYGYYNAQGIKVPFGIFHTLEDYRYQGNLYGAGITYGYQWILGDRWNLQAAIGIGYVGTDYDKYECGPCGDWIKQGHANYFGPTNLFIYYLHNQIKAGSMKKYFLCFVALLIVAGVGAQSFSNPFVTGQKVEKNKNELDLLLELRTDRLDLPSTHSLVITPILESEDKSMKVNYPPVVINGRNREKLYKRAQRIQKESVYTEDPYQVMAYKKGNRETLSYQVTVPFESWMRKATLILKEERIGCAQCELSEQVYTLMSPVLGDPYQPVYNIRYLTPPTEEIKNRDEVRQLQLGFKVNSTVLLPDFENNRWELEKVDSIMRAIHQDDDFTLIGVRISGYASPEGGTQNNMRLSEGRARALVDYMRRTHGLSSSDFTVEGRGEDWKGLAEAVERSYLSQQERADVLRILQTVDVESRKQQLKNLNGGRTYRSMLEILYPPLRRNECVIDFTVRQFELEKARRMIRINPRVMSLNEMYLVAESYQKGSSEYKEAFETAVRLYPESPYAVNNAAAIFMEEGKFDRALEMLQKLTDAPEVWNNLGIALAATGRYEEAGDYFKKAAANGQEMAAVNLEELTKYLEDI